MKYKLIACGGTFDHLHVGHKTFLRWIFSQGEQVLIGLTSDAFAATTKSARIQPFAQRKQALEAFLAEQNLLQKTQVIQIANVFGPLLTSDFAVDAIAVTNDTLGGAVMINTKRQELGLSVLPVVTMSLKILPSGDALSSTAIREGKVDQAGNPWVKKEWQEANYVLPQELRKALQKPFGKMLSSLPKNIQPEKTITVGDVTTKLFQDARLNQHIAIVDFVVERFPTYHSLKELGFSLATREYALSNPAGHIACQSWGVVQEVLLHKDQSVIQVAGEEDLLVLVCILVAPLDFHIYYGQPQEGLVEIVVTIEAKKHAFDLMDQFERA